MGNDNFQDVPYSIISIKHSERLNQLCQGSKYLRKSPEQLIEIADEKKKMMEPVREYLLSLGLQEENYTIQPNISTVVARLSLEQIEDLKKQSFIEGVTLDFQFEIIE